MGVVTRTVIETILVTFPAGIHNGAVIQYVTTMPVLSGHKIYSSNNISPLTTIIARSCGFPDDM